MLKTYIKVLVVDDFASMRKVLSAQLRQLEIDNIDEAEDGSSALEKIRKNKYDVIILDWNIPQMSGIEVVRSFRAESNAETTPIIAITSDAMKETLSVAVEEGVSGYLVKPFTSEILEEKLKGIVGEIEDDIEG